MQIEFLHAGGQTIQIEEVSSEILKLVPSIAILFENGNPGPLKLPEDICAEKVLDFFVYCVCFLENGTMDFQKESMDTLAQLYHISEHFDSEISSSLAAELHTRLGLDLKWNVESLQVLAEELPVREQMEQLRNRLGAKNDLNSLEETVFKETGII